MYPTIQIFSFHLRICQSLLNIHLLPLVFQAEVIFLGQLRHLNLVKLIGYCCEDDERLLVYEFMPRGSLENHLFKSESHVDYDNF